jgi:hypothetical protein
MVNANNRKYSFLTLIGIHTHTEYINKKHYWAGGYTGLQPFLQILSVIILHGLFYHVSNRDEALYTGSRLMYAQR